MSDEQKNEDLKVVVHSMETLMTLPGVRVDRSRFLREQYREFPEGVVDELIAKGPFALGLTKKQIRKKAMRLLNNRTFQSAAASFVTGLPGGFVLGLAIPADILQFYGFMMRLAQEIAYLYGEADLVSEQKVNTEQILLYIGTMLSATKESTSAKLLMQMTVNQLGGKFPHRTLGKRLYQPVARKVSEYLGMKMTKKVFVKQMVKVVPVVGGILAGGITLAALKTMGKRLIYTFEEANFDCTEANLQRDYEELLELAKQEEAMASRLNAANHVTDAKTEATASENLEGQGITEDDAATAEESAENAAAAVVEEKKALAEILDRIENGKKLLDSNLITQAEFEMMKKSLLRHL